jgi:hypothetical protein
VPSLAKRGSYVPAWMPEFPPDHTFKATPQYPTRVSDPKKLRQLIVEEGRLAEAALKRFFDSQAAVLNQIEKERFTNNDVASQKVGHVDLFFYQFYWAIANHRSDN